MGLNNDKTSKVFFRINICYFATRFYFFLYHSGTVIQDSWKLKIMDVFDLYTP